MTAIQKTFGVQMTDELSLCSGCHCMTKSIRVGRTKYKCGKCQHDKSLSDFFWYEATKDNKNDEHKKD